jgi:SAM-dependent methyltransferase
MSQAIVRLYRTAENYRRYTMADAERERVLATLYRVERRFFGRRVLDMACGGGVLGFILEPLGHTYLGVDINPDMIRNATKAAALLGSHNRFLEGDAVNLRVPGRFDTLTLLGNALGHLSAIEFAELLASRRANVHVGSHFVIDYRDTVSMFYQGLWKRCLVETRKRGRVVHRTRAVDTVSGLIHMQAKKAGDWTINFTQSIWSPFIVSTIMADHGWVRVRQRQTHSGECLVEVYRYQGAEQRQSGSGKKRHGNDSSWGLERSKLKASG